jgi:hypothetical protein
VEMAGAGRIDHKTIQIVGSNDGRVTQTPNGKTLKRLGVRRRVGVVDHKLFYQRLGSGGGHSDTQTDFQCSRVGRRDVASPFSLTD